MYSQFFAIQQKLTTRLIVALVCCLLVDVARAQSPVERFLGSLDADTNLASDARNLIRRTWSDCEDCDAGEFLVQGLAVFSPELRRGFDAYDAEKYADCVRILAPLAASDNSFVAIHAAVYEIKALAGMERLLEVGARIEQLIDDKPVSKTDVSTYSYLSPDIAFLRGYCQVADLQYEVGAASLRAFLEDYPDASQRLTVAAEQMLAELANRQPETIGEVADLMNFAGRRLGHRDAGEVVRERQARVIEILDKLIEEAEEQEKNNSSSSSSGGSGGSGSKDSPSSPMKDSKLPGGGPAEGSLGARRHANPGEVWGTMPPAERARILQALRDNFPSRYRRLVEQYYEELAKKP